MDASKREQSASGDWVKAGTLTSFGAKERFLFRAGEKQIALFKTGKGIVAINNRCPHEGYPLIEGTLQKDCVLACNWHGWSFDLETGETVQGRDPVKSYTVDVKGNDIWLNVAAEPTENLRKRALSDLDEAMEEHDYERIARSLCRLDKAGESYHSIAVRAVIASASRLERGMGHTHAGLAEWLALAEEVPEKKNIVMLEALGHFSWDWLFSPKAPIPATSKPWSSEALSEAVEAMDQPTALALVRGAFKAGKTFADLRPLLQQIAFRHFAGFGHPAIYLMKADELVTALGADVEEPLSLLFVRYMCLSAREDLIPEFRQWGHFMAADSADLPVPHAEEWSGMTSNQAMEAVVQSLENPEVVWAALTTGLALNMVRFDDRLEQGVEQNIRQNIGWLDFTHGLTFAESVRKHALENPMLWRSGLLQMACLLGRNVKFLEDTEWRRHLPQEPMHAYFIQQKEAFFDMDHGEYIFAVHRLKTARAAEKLCHILDGEKSEIVLAAVHRYLSSPIRMRHPARTVWQAQQTVMREG